MSVENQVLGPRFTSAAPPWGPTFHLPPRGPNKPGHPEVPIPGSPGWPQTSAPSQGWRWDCHPRPQLAWGLLRAAFGLIWGRFRVERSGVHARPIWDEFWADPGSVWGRFGVDLGVICGQCEVTWDRSRADLGSMWDDFLGPISGRLGVYYCSRFAGHLRSRFGMTFGPTWVDLEVIRGRSGKICIRVAGLGSLWGRQRHCIRSDPPDTPRAGSRTIGRRSKGSAMPAVVREERWPLTWASTRGFYRPAKASSSGSGHARSSAVGSRRHLGQDRCLSCPNVGAAQPRHRERGAPIPGLAPDGLPGCV